MHSLAFVGDTDFTLFSETPLYIQHHTKPLCMSYPSPRSAQFPKTWQTWVTLFTSTEVLHRINITASVWQGFFVCLFLFFYWVDQKGCLVFFCKTKDIFFIFTNNFINLDILSMLTISCYWLPFACVHVQISSYKDTSHSEAGLTYMDSF